MNEPPLQREAGHHIHPERLKRLLGDLSRYGRLPGGGVSRLAFSEADLEARAWLVERMQNAGLSVRSDAAGNLFGRREGKQSGLPSILFGSHIDSVPEGGIFDGALGCLAALEVMSTLQERDIETEHSLEMVVWADEEGVHFGQGLFGSRAATRGTDASELDLTGADGVSLAEWLERYGEEPERLDSAVLDPKRVRAYFELHVEQGGRLYEEEIPIGVVEGIVGISRYTAEVKGFANHAGTTPMRQRQDALYSASKLIQGIREELIARPGNHVGNVGQIQVSPGAPNVIPGRVQFPIELRDLDVSVIHSLRDAIEARAAVIAEQDGTSIDIHDFASEAPAITETHLKDRIESISETLGMASLRLPSGAGHDAQNVAQHGIPTGMIFIPSFDGISHNPREWSDFKDCARGAEVLYRAILDVDRSGA